MTKATILELGARLRSGEVTSRSLCDEALARIDDPLGEGACTFTETFHAAARAEAEAADALRRVGVVPSPLAGLPVSVKDLFDVAGTTTRAGSVTLQNAKPALVDAAIVARLRAAGAVIVGKTNMTEFAFSGLGINPHYGTPRAPFDRATGRIPGGSSSGAAVSVADGMAAVAIGTDTGGSVRIPAAFCGITGFKPTARRVPLAGAYPLSFSQDSIGPLGASVTCCALTEAILAGETPRVPQPEPLGGLRMLVPTNFVRDDVDATVDAAFRSALDVLRTAGAVVDERPFAAFERIPALRVNGGIAGVAAYWWHRAQLAKDESRYDPQIARRIIGGGAITAAEYIDLLRGRADYVAAFAMESERYDVLVC